MRVLFCGSRDWDDAYAIEGGLEMAWVIAQAEFHATNRHDLIIMHGDAGGADTIAGKLADVMGFVVEPHPADWKQYGKPAGIIRNNQMLDLHPDYVFAFQLDSSPGTAHTIKEATRRGIPVMVKERKSHDP